MDEIDIDEEAGVWQPLGYWIHVRVEFGWVGLKVKNSGRPLHFRYGNMQDVPLMVSGRDGRGPGSSARESFSAYGGRGRDFGGRDGGDHNGGIGGRGSSTGTSAAGGREGQGSEGAASEGHSVW